MNNSQNGLVGVAGRTALQQKLWRREAVFSSETSLRTYTVRALQEKGLGVRVGEVPPPPRPAPPTPPNRLQFSLISQQLGARHRHPTEPLFLFSPCLCLPCLHSQTVVEPLSGSVVQPTSLGYPCFLVRVPQETLLSGKRGAAHLSTVRLCRGSSALCPCV